MTTTLKTATTTIVREDDMQQHIEDEKVNAIRNGKLVEVYWHELTIHEQRAAREAFLQSFETAYYY